jgi:hypothetical protein
MAMLKSLTQEDIQVTTEEAEALQKDRQAEVQDGQTQMTLLTVQQVDVEAKVFMDLQAAAAGLAEVLVVQVQQVAETVTEITLEHKEQTQCQTQAQAEAAEAETQAVQESVKLPFG